MGWSLGADALVAFVAETDGEAGLIFILGFCGALLLTLVLADAIARLGLGGAAISSLSGGRTEVHPANQQAGTLAGKRAEGRCRGQIQN